MGIRSVAVYSDADRNSPYTRQADLAIHIGESAPASSYLVQDKIIEAAKKSGANAIHPGYGFLSENANFAQRCADEGIIFVGPNVKAIEEMGSKSRAKALMQEHGVPTVPGYQGEDQSIETLTAAALKIGFPLLLKATAGGGGKGMRIIHHESELNTGIEAAKRESLSAFGNDELIIEKYVASGRHIEFQIFGDKHGNAIHLLERECTIQRRYQKVVEESPSPVLTEDLRKKMGEAAVKAALALNYDNAGTVEFIFDEQVNEFYFLEVNTRLQVEHPVTEEVTGLDLVEMQIEMAQGEKLQLQQADVKSKGYALELRLYAEDAANDFTPVTGTLTRFEWPKVDGLRMETAVESGSEISVFYDPMIAKMIMHDTTRKGAYRKMRYVLENMVCQGMVTNQPFLLELVKNEAVIHGKYDTHFIANNLHTIENKHYTENDLSLFLAAATLIDWKKRDNKKTILRSLPSGWRNNFYEFQKNTWLIHEEANELQYRHLDSEFLIKFGDREFITHLLSIDNQSIRMEVEGAMYVFNYSSVGENYFLQHGTMGNLSIKKKARFPEREIQKTPGGYEAPMPSTIVKILVEPGKQVAIGEPLLVISSMKMENTLLAEEAGIVSEIFVQEGQNVEAGYLLLTLKSEE